MFFFDAVACMNEDSVRAGDLTERFFNFALSEHVGLASIKV